MIGATDLAGIYGFSTIEIRIQDEFKRKSVPIGDPMLMPQRILRIEATLME